MKVNVSLKTPSFFTGGLGYFFNLPEISYVTVERALDHANEVLFEQSLGNFITEYQKENIRFIMGDRHHLEITIELGDIGKVAPSFIEERVKNACQNHKFISSSTIVRKWSGSEVRRNLWPVLNTKNKKHFWYHFQIGFLAGALLAPLAIMLATSFSASPAIGLALGSWYGGWLSGFVCSFRAMYRNLSAHLFNTQEKIAQINHVCQFQALEFGATENTWQDTLLNYSPTRYQTYLYPMTFLSGKENKVLVEKLAPEIKNKFKG
ncbi:MAG: hypothetical protein JSS07_01430 [Proteobacteria bacterium]|nr:hypothetical protein [Pseudomonadota bacterium]